MIDAELAERIEAARPRCGSVVVVAIDGGAAAGKSSLAALVAESVPQSLTIHTDDLLAGWGDQFGFWPTLRTSVLQPLAQGRPGRYRRFDWTTGSFGETVEVPVVTTLIVEGVSAITACQPWLSLGIFLDISRDERERRWVARDGPMQPEWQRWLDAEDRFFADNPLPPGSLIRTG